MCGINGIAFTNRSHRMIDASVLERMRDVIRHRGPDDSGAFIAGPIGLGHRRLSIVDVASGHQPMTNEDGALQITYNGEIYNHGDFRESLESKGHRYRTHCDTETILHLYEEHEAARICSCIVARAAFSIYDDSSELGHQLFVGVSAAAQIIFLKGNRMKLSVFGIGYVGCVSAACFAKEGHNVLGVDVNPTKVEIINSGNSPIVEPGVSELMSEAVSSGHLRATTNAQEAVHNSDISLVCVGTPSRQNGSLDLGHVTRVCEEIGAALKTKKGRHVVVMRSTMLPGTIHDVVVPALERTSGKKNGSDFGVCINPEFLREGSSLKDFYAPPFTLIGADDETSAGSVKELYAKIDAPLFMTPVKTAEMIKYVCNSFHALKVSFANEVGNICKALAIDSHKVMEIFCEDKKLNLSPYYMIRMSDCHPKI